MVSLPTVCVCWTYCMRNHSITAYNTPLSTSLEGRFCKRICCTESLFPYNALAAKSSLFKYVFVRVDTILFDPLSHPDTASLDPP